MKASVITLHTVYNYGTQLQALATQKKLLEYFDEVEFIDFRRQDTYGKGLINTFSHGNPLRTLAVLPTISSWKRKFGKFQKEYLNISEETFYQDSDFSHFVEDSDVYFTGSDQVWNTGWNNGVIAPLYLSFVHDKPKYAYASSFGKNKLADSEIAESKDFIKDFKRISVREESGLEILEKQYGYHGAIRILDPTLVLDSEYWRSISPQNKIRGDYILIYNLNRNKDFDEYAEKLARKTGCKLYRFCTRYDQIFRSGKSLLIPDVLDFVSLVDNAKIVLTDSFHATAFSINMGTEPICVYPADYSGRLSEFLKLVGCENRHAESYDDLDVVSRHIDFNKVNRILEKERKKVDDYLKLIKTDLSKHGK